MTYTYAELFAGAGGLSMGLDMAGWEPAAHAEIEPHARAILRKHWPDTRLDGDVSQVNGADYAGITLLSGGSPCQDLSIAGKRQGMTEGSGTRSSLYFEQVRIWQESNAPYFLWENVLGALSSNTGRDFAAVLSALVGAAVPVPDDGWRSAGVASGPTGVAAWRVLDAQYFGVPQRRRRVFVLGARAGGVDPAEVLSLRESVSGHPPESRTKGEGVAANPRNGVAPTLDAGEWRGPNRNQGGVIADGNYAEGWAGCLTPWDNQSKRVFASDGVFPSLQAAEKSGQQQPAVLTYEWHNQDSRIKPVEIASSLNLNAEGREGHLILPLTGTLFTKQGFGDYAATPNADALDVRSGPDNVAATDLVVYAIQNPEMESKGQNGLGISEANAPMFTLESRGHGVVPSIGIPRRLMPVECERLMGWPDGHTAAGVAEQGREYALSDTARYKLCGNGVATPVAAWIGVRLKAALDSFTQPV